MPTQIQYLVAPPIDTVRLEAVGQRVATARGLVGTARASTEVARGTDWFGVSGDAYRAALDAEVRSTRLLCHELDGLLQQLRRLARETWAHQGPGPATAVVSGGWSAAEAPPRPTCWGGGGRQMRVGAAADYLSVDPAALGQAALLLGDAADALDDAHGRLAAALDRLTPVGWGVSGPLAGVRVMIGSLLTGPRSPRRQVASLRELATSTRTAAGLFDDGEAGAWVWLRKAAAVAGGLVADNPSFQRGFLQRVMPAGLAVAGGAWLASKAAPDDGDTLGKAGGALVSSGAADVVLAGLAGWLRATAAPGVHSPTLTPVRDSAAWLAEALERLGGPVVAVPLVDPPQLPTADDLGSAMGLVSRSYNWSVVPGTDPAPDGTVTVQRQLHPDGTTTWVVAIPGTQALLGGAVAHDGLSDAELAAGVRAPVVQGVVDAMRDAGVAPDDPVVLVGHSLGGMIAMSVAARAAGAFRIRGVVTAGSPSIPDAVPPGVPVVRLEHDEDAVPHLDDEPTRVTDDVTVVHRSVGSITPAHFPQEYQQTAELTDAAVAEHPGDAPAIEAVTSLLGGEGTTSTTYQYQLRRQPIGGGAGGGGW